jgi:hypothetical protein
MLRGRDPGSETRDPAIRDSRFDDETIERFDDSTIQGLVMQGLVMSD